MMTDGQLTDNGQTHAFRHKLHTDKSLQVTLHFANTRIYFTFSPKVKTDTYFYWDGNTSKFDSFPTLKVLISL